MIRRVNRLFFKRSLEKNIMNFTQALKILLKK